MTAPTAASTSDEPTADAVTVDAGTSERLRCDGLSIGYGDLNVGRGIDLVVHRNEILAVLGPNGAGKSTLLLTIGGFLSPLDGSIAVDGAPLHPGSARRANRAGVVLVPDSRALFTQLTALENLQLAVHRGGPGRRRDARAVPCPRTAHEGEGRDALGRRAADARRGRGRWCSHRRCCSSTR